jgi:hypothetical protein
MLLIPILSASTVLLAAHASADPIITDAFTADPAPLVVGDTVYISTPARTKRPTSDTRAM